MTDKPPSSHVGLSVNVQAPHFEIVDIFGRNINLAEYRGKKVFLGFFRHAGCPFCNLRVHSLQKHHLEFREKNLEMIFFFESKKRLLLNSTFHKEVNPIPIISDPERFWYETYGVEQSTAKSTASHLTTFIQTAIKAKWKGVPMHLMKDGESFSTMPAEFLIDEEGVIREVHYCKGLTDRMAMGHIMDFADQRTATSVA